MAKDIIVTCKKCKKKALKFLTGKLFAKIAGRSCQKLKN